MKEACSGYHTTFSSRLIDENNPFSAWRIDVVIGLSLWPTGAMEPDQQVSNKCCDRFV